jgi:hypothetical protein
MFAKVWLIAIKCYVVKIEVPVVISKLENSALPFMMV